MAVTRTSRFHNGSAVGATQVGDAFDRFAMDSNPKVKVGHKIEDGDGNTFRYGHFGADTNRGVLVAQDLSESSLVDSDNIVVAPASAQTTTDGTINSKYIEITLASVTVNMYAGGKLVITDDTGEGYTYDIVGNTATDDPASGNFRLQIKQPLQVAVDATSDIAIIGNKYANLETSNNTDSFPAGVSCATMDVSVASYGWVQTKGLVGVLTDGTVVLGNAVVQGSVPGSVAPSAASTSKEVGRCLIVGDDTGHSVIELDLD